MPKPNLKDGFDGKPGWDGEKNWLMANKKWIAIGAIIFLFAMLLIFGTAGEHIPTGAEGH